MKAWTEVITIDVENADVIPREGVESIIKNVYFLLLPPIRDPERGS